MKIIKTQDGYMTAYRNEYGEEEAIVLIHNSWNDYGYNTTKSIAFWNGNKLFDLTTIKIIESKEATLSLGSSLDYYERLNDLFNEDTTFDILITLRDSLFLEYCKRNKDFKYTENIPYNIDLSLALKDTDEFKMSLLRDINYDTFYKDIEPIIFHSHFNPTRFNFNIDFQLNNFSDSHKITFEFNDDFFPPNVSVLIGKNGVGKTQTLKYISEGLAQVGDFDIKNGSKKQSDYFSNIPNFRKIVTISTSPYEKFYNSNDSKLLKHCDFSSLNLQESYYEPLLNILKYDISACDFKKTKLKLITLYKALKLIIPQFQYIGFIPLKSTDPFSSNLKDIFLQEKEYEIIEEYDKESLKKLNISSKNKIRDSKKESILEIAFMNNDYKPITLSSGQTVFFKLIFSVLANIETDSILLFDEPEAYLHPNAEIVFMRFLKKILKDFSSYSIIATHSAIITREIPSKFVKIFFIDENENPNIFEPKIQTLGASIEMLTNIIFENLLEQKPYEEWLKEKFENASSIESVLKDHADKLNPEMLAYIRNKVIKNG